MTDDGGACRGRARVPYRSATRGLRRRLHGSLATRRRMSMAARPVHGGGDRPGHGHGPDHPARGCTRHRAPLYGYREGMRLAAPARRGHRQPLLVGALRGLRRRQLLINVGAGACSGPSASGRGAQSRCRHHRMMSEAKTDLRSAITIRRWADVRSAGAAHRDSSTRSSSRPAAPNRLPARRRGRRSASGGSHAIWRSIRNGRTWRWRRTARSPAISSARSTKVAALTTSPPPRTNFPRICTST